MVQEPLDKICSHTIESSAVMNLAACSIQADAPRHSV